MYKTVDGGQNWNIVQNNDFDINEGDSYKELNFITELIGYGIMSGGLYKTIDGGINWTEINNVVGQSHADFFDFPSENVGYTYYTSNEIGTLSDGGITWNNINPSDPKEEIILNMSFVNVILDGRTLILLDLTE